MVVEQVGFDGVMCLDYFVFWFLEQGELGFVLSWVVVVFVCMMFLIGMVNVFGQCYYFVVVVQVFVMFEEMFFGWFWVVLGSGEVMNEYVMGDGWLVKVVCNECLVESVDVICCLFVGEEVSYDGLVCVYCVWIWSFFEVLLLLFVMVVSVEIVVWFVGWVDGFVMVVQLLLVLWCVIDEYCFVGGVGFCSFQVYLSWVVIDVEVFFFVCEQWCNGVLVLLFIWNIEQLEEFDVVIGVLDDVVFCVVVLIDYDVVFFVDCIVELVMIGFDWVYLYYVGREQVGFFWVVGFEFIFVLKE